MISKDEMFPSLLKVLPDFQSEWDSFAAEWQNDPKCSRDGLPLYILLSDLARFLVKLLENGDSESLKTAFSVIETWQVEGDSYVKESATVGLLEGLQNLHLHQSTTPKQFEPFLGPISAVEWNNLYAFWKDAPK